MQKRWIKIVPHVVDTTLLISAMALTFTISQYPFLDAWLTAKTVGLLLYIGLGQQQYGVERGTSACAVGAFHSLQVQLLDNLNDKSR